MSSARYNDFGPSHCQFELMERSFFLQVKAQIVRLSHLKKVLMCRALSIGLDKAVELVGPASLVQLFPECLKNTILLKIAAYVISARFTRAALVELDSNLIPKECLMGWRWLAVCYFVLWKLCSCAVLRGWLMSKLLTCHLTSSQTSYVEAAAASWISYTGSREDVSHKIIALC